MFIRNKSNIHCMKHVTININKMCMYINFKLLDAINLLINIRYCRSLKSELKSTRTKFSTAR